MSIENLETYLNRNGYPMIRRCFNCKFWKLEKEAEKLGVCNFQELFFAFTLKPTVHPIQNLVTRDFYLCAEHQFENEDKLEAVSKKVSLKDSIKTKDQVK